VGLPVDTTALGFLVTSSFTVIHGTIANYSYAAQQTNKAIDAGREGKLQSADATEGLQ